MISINEFPQVQGQSSAQATRPAVEIHTDDGRLLIYDLERTFVFRPPKHLESNPEELYDLKTPSPEIEDWLSESGLMANVERPASRLERRRDRLPPVTDVSIDLSGNCNMDCRYCFEKPIFSRNVRMNDDTLMETLEFAFQKSQGSDSLSIHFGSGEPLIEFRQLQKLVAAATALAASNGIELGFELTTNGTLVDEEVARFLAAHPFNVRVSCDGPAHMHDAFRVMGSGRTSYQRVERGLRQLLAVMADRVTVNSVICSRVRLIEVWDWAKEQGIRHLHAVKVGSEIGSGLGMENNEVSDYAADLDTICRDLLSQLVNGETLVEFQPITKILRRLMLPAPIDRFCGVAGSYLGVATNGTVYPCFRHLGLDSYQLGHVASGIDDQARLRYRQYEAASVDDRPVCSDCWARYLCGGGCYADSVVYGSSPGSPLTSHCSFWKLEIAQAIGFYDELRQLDPNFLLRLFGDDIDDLVKDQSPNAMQHARSRKTF